MKILFMPTLYLYSISKFYNVHVAYRVEETLDRYSQDKRTW